MKLLVPGGAGYIGSHMVKYAQNLGHEVVVLDDFSTGHEWAVKDCEVLRVNILDRERLAKALHGRHFDGVIHFAAKSIVADSIKSPELYYSHNVVGCFNLISEMLNNGINNLVFSSTAAIFGNPVTDKITEDHPRNPINPYGQTKLNVENMLKDICSAYSFNATCFRYFNAAGAEATGTIGELHEPETHLIPNILRSIKFCERSLKVFGNDYDTYDGTCIRDFVHVADLAQAHLLGLEHMKEKCGFSSYNLGSGDGFSVLDVIKSCQRVTGKSVTYDIEKRREGDPEKLVADPSKAMKVLGWRPEFSELDPIIRSAWLWHNN